MSHFSIFNFQFLILPPRLRVCVVKVGYAVAICAVLSACASDFVTDPNRPRPRRAVESPNALGSGNSEVMGGPVGSVSFMTVDIPNNKNEQPVVHTIAEPLSSLSTPRPAASRPATQPASEAPPANNEIKVVAQQHPADQFRLTLDNQANADLWILCPTGIGTVTLERMADNWPALIHVHLRYDQDRGFSRLDSCSAAELTGAGGKVILKTNLDKENGLAQITVPGFARGERIEIDWMDISQ